MNSTTSNYHAIDHRRDRTRNFSHLAVQIFLRLKSTLVLKHTVVELSSQQHTTPSLIKLFPAIRTADDLTLTSHLNSNIVSTTPHVSFVSVQNESVQRKKGLTRSASSYLQRTCKTHGRGESQLPSDLRKG